MFKKLYTLATPRATMLGVIFFFLMGLVGSALAHGLVDQSQENWLGFVRLSYMATARGQSFVPTVDNLVAVDLFTQGDAPGEIRVSIHEGSPDGAELATVTSVLIPGLTWNHIDFGTPIPLTPGNTFSIRVSQVTGVAYLNFANNEYPAGTGWRCNPDCNPQPTLDYSFRTYYEEPADPEDLIDLLVDDVEALVDSGVLNSGQGNALTEKLENALKSLDRGNENAAINQLQAFINQVNDFINGGILTDAEGQALIDAANRIINAINAT